MVQKENTFTKTTTKTSRKLNKLGPISPGKHTMSYCAGLFWPFPKPDLHPPSAGGLGYVPDKTWQKVYDTQKGYADIQALYLFNSALLKEPIHVG